MTITGDFTLKEISELSLIKDKNGMDLKPFKKKKTLLEKNSYIWQK